MNYKKMNVKLSVLMLLLFVVNVIGEEKAATNLIRAEVKQYKGTPMLFVNDKVTAPLFFFDNKGGWAENTAANVLKELQLAKKYNIRIHEIGFPSCLSWKDKDGNYNYDGFDKTVKEILDVDPQALIIMRFWLAAANSDLWSKQNPDEIMVYDDGTKWGASIASKKFLDEVCENIKSLAKHIEQSSYVNNIIGYHPAYLHTGEMFYPGWDEGKVGDFSKPMVSAFQEYAKNKYKTEESLRDAWKDKKITFDTIKIPTVKDRQKTDIGIFKTNVNGTYVSDFYELYNEIVADAVIQLGKVIKEATNNRCLSISFYGYLFELMYPMGGQNSGHYALRKVLDSQYIDALAGPLSYYGRDSKETDGSYFMTAVDSVHLHNKLWINEDDTRTHLASKENLKSCDNLNDSLQVIRRSFANMITHSAGTWWMDLPGAGWWGQDEIFADLQKLTGIYTKWLDESDTCNYKPEVAVIVDEKSMFTQGFSGKLMKESLFFNRTELDRMGAPCGYYLLSDLVDGLVPAGTDAKLYIFLNTFDMTEKERQYIDANLKKGNKTLVWLYGSGFMKDGLADTGNIRSLTGIDVEINSEEEFCAATEIDKSADNPIMKGLRVNNFGEQDFTISPLFFSKDAEAKVLGNYVSITEPSLVVKEMDGWKSIFIGTPRLHRNLLYNICKYAGVHTYISTDDRIYANQNIVGIYSMAAGKKTVTLPGKMNVTDLLTGEKVGENIDKFDIDCKQYESKLYFIK